MCVRGRWAGAGQAGIASPGRAVVLCKGDLPYPRSSGKAVKDFKDANNMIRWAFRNLTVAAAAAWSFHFISTSFKEKRRVI